MTPYELDSLARLAEKCAAYAERLQTALSFASELADKYEVLMPLVTTLEDAKDAAHCAQRIATYWRYHADEKPSPKATDASSGARMEEARRWPQ